MECNRGMLVKFAKPVGKEDSRIAKQKMGRSANVVEVCNNGYVRVTFFGDAKGLNYLIHPESLQAA